MSLTAPTVTGYQPFWQLTGDKTAYSMTVSAARAPQAKAIARWMARRGLGDVRGALAALIGAAAGGTATVTFKQVSAPDGPEQSVPVVTSIGDFGGNRVIDTITQINRATTAADVTELKKWFDNSLLEAGITYPTTSGGVAVQGIRNGGVVSF